MEKQYDVIGVENLIMDFAVRINKLPQTDGFAYIRDYCWQSGGNAASAIVALARLGSDCGMVRVVIQHFSKNTVISMVLGHPNSEITCIPPS